MILRDTDHQQISAQSNKLANALTETLPDSCSINASEQFVSEQIKLLDK
mgnify:CR=1 FL=1